MKRFGSLAASGLLSRALVLSSHHHHAQSPILATQSTRATAVYTSSLSTTSCWSTTNVCGVLRQQARFQTTSALSSIKKAKGVPSISFSAYKVFHVIYKHDPRLKGRQGPQLTAILFNRFSRLRGNQHAGYSRTAIKLNRFKSLATQRLILSSIVMQKFGVENFRRIYPNSTVTMVSAQQVVKRLLAATQPANSSKKPKAKKTSTRKNKSGQKTAKKK